MRLILNLIFRDLGRDTDPKLNVQELLPLPNCKRVRVREACLE